MTLENGLRTGHQQVSSQHCPDLDRSVQPKWILLQFCCSPIVLANFAISRIKSLVSWMYFFGFCCLRFAEKSFLKSKVFSSVCVCWHVWPYSFSVATYWSVFSFSNGRKVLLIFSLLEVRILTSSRNSRNKSQFCLLICFTCAYFVIFGYSPCFGKCFAILVTYRNIGGFQSGTSQSHDRAPFS